MGGLGLNLCAANVVILSEPWWNPAIEDQAVDRINRIGQTKSMTVYRLVTKDTIEEQIKNIRDQKRQLIKKTVEKCAENEQENTKENDKILQDNWREFLKRVN